MYLEYTSHKLRVHNILIDTLVIGEGIPCVAAVHTILIQGAHTYIDNDPRVSYTVFISGMHHTVIEYRNTATMAIGILCVQ